MWVLNWLCRDDRRRGNIQGGWLNELGYVGGWEKSVECCFPTGFVGTTETETWEQTGRLTEGSRVGR